MAVQLPNFLAAQLVKPDYSGIGDVVTNYYQGKLYPKEDLIKQIQAEFARPNAESVLQTSRLNNKKAQLEIEKLAMEIAQQKELERQLKQAFAGMNSNQTIPNQSNIPSQSIEDKSPSPRQMTYVNDPTDMLNAINPNLGAALSQQKPVIPEAISSNQQKTPDIAETIITEGSPNLAGVDLLWDSNPLARKFLKDKGYNKTQQIKFDNKTGKTSVITTYPSGKVTVKSMGAAAGEEGIPLTNKMISKHQNIISSIDTALPIIDKILDEGKTEKEGGKGLFQPYPRSSGYLPGMGYVPGWMSQSKKYENLVNSALDSLIGAYGLPMTNEGINTVKDQLLIGHGETVYNYKKRLKELIKDLKRRKEYSMSEVKKSNKIQPINRADTGSMYSTDEWEAV